MVWIEWIELSYVDHINRFDRVFGKYAQRDIEVFAFDQRVHMSPSTPTT